MRKALWLLSIVTLSPGFAFPSPSWAQQGTPQPDTAPPTPDKNGVYQAVPGIDAPYLVSPALATSPPASDATTPPHIVRFTAVIGADGSVQSLNITQPQGGPFEDSAATAVKQSKFAPGTLNGAPVPVEVCLRVPFLRMRPAVPRVRDCPDPGVDSMGGTGMANRLPPGTRPPRILSQANPEYSDLARKKRIQGVVVISLTVNDQGQPTDLHVERSLGYGLDENALASVGRYRFQPATTRDGTPIPYRLTVEVSYRLY